MVKTTDNKIKGPVYFDKITEHITNPENLGNHEWLRKLKTGTGGTKFKIKYYGDRMGSLVVATDFAPQKIIAIDAITGEELIIFDGCTIGYNALFCDQYSKEQIENRPVNQVYLDDTGEDTFEVILSAYYGFNYDDEFLEAVDEDGMIELVNGQKESYENAKRNGCDTFQVFIINKKGKKQTLFLKN